MSTASINETNASTLAKYAIEHAAVKRELTRSVVNILAHHVRQGAYSEARALKAWGHVAEMAARHYVAQHGAPGDHWRGMFNEDTRRAACALLSDHYADEIDRIAASLPGKRS